MSFISNAKQTFKQFRYDLKHEVSTNDKMSAKERLDMALVNSGGENCITTLKNSFFNVFLTTALGLNPSTIALLATITTVMGYVKDPIISLIIEATRTKWGRFKPYVVICMPATVLLCFAFMLNPFTDETAKVAYVFTLEIIINIVGGFSGAWGNMKLCLSRDQKDREKYFKLGKVFRDIVGCFPGIMPVLIDICKSANISSRYVFIGMAILLFPFSMYSALQAKNLTERITLPAREKFFASPKDVWYNIRMVFKNKNAILLWLLKIGNIFNYVADIANAYVFMYCYGWYSLSTVVGVCGGFASWTCVILSKKIFEKLGYKGVAIGYKALMATSMFILLAIGYGDAWYYIVGVCLCRILGASLEQIEGIATSLLNTDIWDHYEWKTGVRNETVTGLIGSYVMMPVSIVSPLFYAYVFNKIGFQAGENVSQTPETLRGLFIVYTVFIAVGSLCDIVPYLFIRLPKKTMAKVHADLAVREQAKEYAKTEGKELSVAELLSIDEHTDLSALFPLQFSEQPVEETAASTSE